MTAETTALQCSHCAKEFKYDSERKRHEQSHSPQFRCKVCSKTFSFVSALRRHGKQHERTGSVECDECSRMFRDHTLLGRHKKYAHGGVYRCTKCDSILSSAAALRNHMKVHRVEAERRYQCRFEGCGKTFNFAHHLKHHELSHTDTKQHFCAICGKGFIQSHHLKTHLRSHDPNVSLYCSYPGCKKKFTTEYARKRHVITTHRKKADSGISSDSSSPCDTSRVSPKRPVIYLSSGQEPTEARSVEASSPGYISVISPSIIKRPVLYISPSHEETNGRALIYTAYQETPEDLSVGKVRETESSVQPDANDVGDCKSALGGCIMNIKDETCVCSQISDNISDNFDFEPLDNETTKMNKLTIEDLKFPNPCEGCACSEHCDVSKSICGTLEVTPEMECRNGVVKIKSTADVEFVGGKVESKFVPYNSCKAVLGNCIVSGNGTIGDGCLCARMALDEQATAQEIEDITPFPKDYSQI